MDRQGERWRLLRGADRRKDQSYFLYPLSQGLLRRLLLPVGAYDKPAIRAMAASAGFASAGRPDSQDISGPLRGLADVLVVIQPQGTAHRLVPRLPQQQGGGGATGWAWACPSAGGSPGSTEGA